MKYVEDVAAESGFRQITFIDERRRILTRAMFLYVYRKECLTSLCSCLLYKALVIFTFSLSWCNLRRSRCMDREQIVVITLRTFFGTDMK